MENELMDFCDGRSLPEDDAGVMCWAPEKEEGEEEEACVRGPLHLLSLPDELLVRVLSFLSRLADATHAFSACQRLYSLRLDDHYWR